MAAFYRCTPFSIRIRPAQLNSAYEDSDEVKDKRRYVEDQILKDKAMFANRKSGSKTVAVQYGKCTKYGKGYVMEETTLLTEQFPFPEKKGQDPWNFIFRPDTYKEISIKDMHMKCITGIEAFKASLKKFLSFGRHQKRVEPQSAVKREFYDSLLPQAQKSVVLYSQPLTNNWSPLVLDSSTASLVDLSNNKYMLSGSLPPACRELYDNVISANVSLDWPHSTPKLSVAIAYSITTKGKILYEKLKENDHGNGMSYLRIALGCHRGSSPGIPYVLEIWPPKSQSPIHSHGNS